MAKIHCLTVGHGDCTIIEHDSGCVTMIDICGGNKERKALRENAMLSSNQLSKPRGNYAMCSSAGNPLDYLNDNNLNNIFRFILTHPDMDHMDGFNALMQQASVSNFWDSGARKVKPDFSGTPYNEADWDRYVKVRDGKDSPTVVTPKAGSYFSYANEGRDSGSGDYTHIVSASQNIVDEANDKQEFNDASYIIVFNSAAGRIVIPGDAHDESWEYAINNHGDLLRNVAFLLAPHHGRRSDRDWSFLDHLNPRFTLLGCAPSQHLAYDAWRNRGLEFMTQNQAGNLVAHPRQTDCLDIYIENESYVRDSGGDTSIKNNQGFTFYKTV